MSEEIKELQEKVARLEAALEQADMATKAAAEYVEKTQPNLDKAAMFEDAFLKKAHVVAGSLAQQGIIERTEITPLIDKLAADPLLALELVEKVAGMVTVDSFGKAAEEIATRQAQVDALDPFQKLALFGDSRAEMALNTGLVE